MKQVVLSIFSGCGELDKAFEAEGFFVVTLGDILMGSDIRDKHVPKGYFDGIIGGPPCQWASKAKGSMETPSINLIPEFLRIIDEAQPTWAMMENVDTPQTRSYMETVAPEFQSVSIRDWDCGGHTNRIRRFWFKGILAPDEPPVRPGKPAQSVLATSWKHRAHKDGMHSALDPNVAAYLQGYPDLAHKLICAFPDAMSRESKNRFAVHMVGNGVPKSMGLYLAKWVKSVI